MWKFKKFPQLTNSSLIYSDAADCSSTSDRSNYWTREFLSPKLVAEVSSGKYISLKDERFTSECELKLIEKCSMCAAEDVGEI